MTDTVIVGRFQPMHKGHHKVIQKYSEEHDLAVAIGSCEEKGTEDNPLSFEDRKKIVTACFPDIPVVGLKDYEETEQGHQKWLEELKRETGSDKVISQNKLVKRLVQEDPDLELIQQDMHDPNIYSGTEVRRRIKSGEEWRYLVPECCENEIADNLEKIKASGIQYEFEPGWKRENSYYDTYEK